MVKSLLMQIIDQGSPNQRNRGVNNITGRVDTQNGTIRVYPTWDKYDILLSMCKTQPSPNSYFVVGKPGGELNKLISAAT